MARKKHQADEPTPKRQLEPGEIEALLEPLGEQDLRETLTQLLHKHPEVMETLERTLAKRGKTPAGGVKALPQVNIRLLEKVLRNAVRTMTFSYEGEGDFTEVEAIFAEVEPFLEAGAYGEALELLDPLTAAFAEEGEANENSYYANDKFVFGNEPLMRDLDLFWAQVILGTEPDAKEATRLLEKLEEYRDLMLTEWSGDELVIAIQTLRDLGGESSSEEDWEALEDHYLYDYYDVRLRVLEHKGRFAEALALAEEAERDDAVLRMKLFMGDLEEVMHLYPERMQSVFHSLNVSQTLHAQGHNAEALAIAKHGLSLPDDAKGAYTYRSPRHDRAVKDARRDLAALAQTLAQAEGDEAYVLEAAFSEFKSEPSPARYKKLESLAGEAWQGVKEKALATLRESADPDVKVSIFLKEGLHEDAIEAVKGSYQRGLVHEVMDAVMTTQPQWVIKEAKERAEKIMNAGSTGEYDDASDWLIKVRQAHETLDQKSAWKTYFAEVNKLHARKRNLMKSFKDKKLS